MADLRAGSSTHTGQLRPENEDNLLVTDRLFVVADGMGGHEAGEVASQIAVDRIGELLEGDQPPAAPEVVEAIRVANGDIFRAAIANPGQHGMGTTVTAIAVISDPYAGRAAPNIDLNDGIDTDPDQPGDLTPVTPAVPSEALVLANVGDSRTYLFRHGRLRRVTVDHSYVQELVATGHITEAEARDHPRRNIITRALGIEPEVRVDWWTLPLIRGDRFLLCSDGLVDEVADVDIASTLTIESDPQVAADRLVEKANEAGDATTSPWSWSMWSRATNRQTRPKNSTWCRCGPKPAPTRHQRERSNSIPTQRLQTPRPTHPRPTNPRPRAGDARSFVCSARSRWRHSW